VAEATEHRSTERLEPQPNGDCRRRRHVRPWVSQVPWYCAGGPDVARGFLAPGATKPRSRSRFPKSREARDSRYDKKMRISSTEEPKRGGWITGGGFHLFEIAGIKVSLSL
jgi:hypothetical protein